MRCYCDCLALFTYLFIIFFVTSSLNGLGDLWSLLIQKIEDWYRERDWCYLILLDKTPCFVIADQISPSWSPDFSQLPACALKCELLQTKGCLLSQPWAVTAIPGKISPDLILSSGSDACRLSVPKLIWKDFVIILLSWLNK